MRYAWHMALPSGPPAPDDLLLMPVQRKYHELFIHSGGLGVIKAWLEPYADGSLPNVRIRTAMMKACMVSAGDPALPASGLRPCTTLPVPVQLLLLTD
jgi:hypothetical protein